MYINVDHTLLCDRVQYISCLSQFHKEDRNTKGIDINFPYQKYMSVKQCREIFKALCAISCILELSRIDIEAIIYFAAYFQCTYIFEHALDIIRTDLMKLPRAIKTLILFLGYDDPLTFEVMEFACNHLNICYREEIIELMKPVRRRYELNVQPIEYVTARLGKKIRDAERKKIYIFSSTYIMCMLCQTLLVLRKKDDIHVVYIPCCQKPIHLTCFVHFLQKTERRGKKKCIYCDMNWCHGVLPYHEQYVKWCTEKACHIKNQ